MLLSSMAILGLIPHAARGASQQQLTINSIDVAADTEKPGNQIRAYVTISGKDGRSVPGLSAEKFSAIEDGKAIPIDGVIQTTDPMAIILAIDTSGSMLAQDTSGRTAMEAARQAAIDFISMLSSEDQIGVFTFNRETTRLVDFTLDHQAVANAIADIRARPKASTRLYDTIIEAVKKAAEIPRGRRAIIVLTDGKDEQAGGIPRSVHQFRDVIDAATTQTIRMPIYTIGVGPKVDSAELDRMARLTGGRSLLATSFTEVKQMYQIIAEQLKNQYRIQFISRAPSGEHSLVIKIEENGQTAQDEKRFWSPPLLALLAPEVRFISPQTDARVGNTIPVQLEINPAKEIVKIRYYVDGQLKNEIRNPPFDSFEWNTQGLAPGLHVLRVEAITAGGKSGIAEITVSSVVPEVVITEPKSAQIAEGDFQVKVRIRSDAALAKIRLYVDGGLHTERDGPPYDTFQLNTADLTPGRHVLGVSVEDKNGRVGRANMTVTIPQAPAAGPESTWGVVILGIVAIAAAIAGCYGLIRMRRKRSAAQDSAPAQAFSEPARPSSPLAVEDEDETVFFPEIGAHISVPSATLTVITSPGADAGHVFDIQGELKLGRHEQNDIVILDKSVSRKHAEIYFDENTYYLRDLGSRYGTIVNRRRISLDASSLFDGAQIQLGPRTLLEFHLKPVDEDDATVIMAPDKEEEPEADATVIMAPDEKKEPEADADPDDDTLKIGS